MQPADGGHWNCPLGEQVPPPASPPEPEVELEAVVPDEEPELEPVASELESPVDVDPEVLEALPPVPLLLELPQARAEDARMDTTSRHGFITGSYQEKLSYDMAGAEGCYLRRPIASPTEALTRRTRSSTSPVATAGFAEIVTGGLSAPRVPAGQALHCSHGGGRIFLSRSPSPRPTAWSCSICSGDSGRMGPSCARGT